MSWRRERTVAYKSLAGGGTPRIFVRRLCDTRDEEFEPSRFGKIPNLSRVHKCPQRPSAANARCYISNHCIANSRFLSLDRMHCTLQDTGDSSKIFFTVSRFNLKQFPLVDSTIHYTELFANAKIAILARESATPYRYQNNIKDEKRKIVKGKSFIGKGQDLSIGFRLFGILESREL